MLYSFLISPCMLLVPPISSFLVLSRLYYALKGSKHETLTALFAFLLLSFSKVEIFSPVSYFLIVPIVRERESFTPTENNKRNFNLYVHGSGRSWNLNRIVTGISRISSSFNFFSNFHYDLLMSFFTSSRPVLGPTQPPIQWVPGVKRPGCQADYSHPTDAEVKKTWIYTSTPPYVFMA
jgi:hypothetical protein